MAAADRAREAAEGGIDARSEDVEAAAGGFHCTENIDIAVATVLFSSACRCPCREPSHRQ